MMFEQDQEVVVNRVGSAYGWKIGKVVGRPDWNGQYLVEFEDQKIPALRRRMFYSNELMPILRTWQQMNTLVYAMV